MYLQGIFFALDILFSDVLRCERKDNTGFFKWVN